MHIRLGPVELSSARADSVEVLGRDAWREQGRALVRGIPRLRTEKHCMGQLGRLSDDGWTSARVQQFIDTWPTATSAALIRLLCAANELNRNSDGFDIDYLAGITHERLTIYRQGRLRANGA